MIGALWILAFTVVAGVLLYLGELAWRKKNPSQTSGAEMEEETAPEPMPQAGHGDSGLCCGLHLVCEQDSLSPMSAEILYYDDEELDRFKGRSADSYSSEEIEEFRDVLMTLRHEDILGWARSVTQRELELPSEVRDELLLLVNEIRKNS